MRSAAVAVADPAGPGSPTQLLVRCHVRAARTTRARRRRSTSQPRAGRKQPVFATPRVAEAPHLQRTADLRTLIHACAVTLDRPTCSVCDPAVGRLYSITAIVEAQDDADAG